MLDLSVNSNTNYWGFLLWNMPHIIDREQNNLPLNSYQQIQGFGPDFY